MNILVQLSHPAHFHLYKNAIKNWMSNGNQVFILIKSKDILEELMIQSGLPYFNILPDTTKNRSKLTILKEMLLKDWRIFLFVIKHKIDFLVGSTPEIGQIGWLLRKRTVYCGEDDASVIPAFAKVGAPFLETILSPVSCNNGSYEKKTIKYQSFQKLAYLHPNVFIPDKKIVEKYFQSEKPYFIIRFAKLNAHHDVNAKGISTEIAQRLIYLLKPHGDIYITSERELEPQFEQYRIHINPLDMHHVLAFSTMFIGDSQSMAVESAMLGVPNVRFNDFVGKIGVLNELDNKYKLSHGIKTQNVDSFYQTIEKIIKMPDRKQIYADRRKKMLSDKIDFSAFLTWFVENYPESKKIMRENPDYQYRFK